VGSEASRVDIRTDLSVDREFSRRLNVPRESRPRPTENRLTYLTPGERAQFPLG